MSCNKFILSFKKHVAKLSFKKQAYHKTQFHANNVHSLKNGFFVITALKLQNPLNRPVFHPDLFPGGQFPPELRNSPRIFLDITCNKNSILYVSKFHHEPYVSKYCLCCSDCNTDNILIHMVHCNTDNILIHTVHDGTWKRTIYAQTPMVSWLHCSCAISVMNSLLIIVVMLLVCFTDVQHCYAS
jgi:hypothetical protein